MIRRPPRSTLDRSSAASDVYKRQDQLGQLRRVLMPRLDIDLRHYKYNNKKLTEMGAEDIVPVSYTHLRAHETVLDLVCRLLLEKKKNYETK